jgi:hypothetical protein
MEILNHRLDFGRHGLCRFDRFTGHWKGPNESLVIGLAPKLNRENVNISTFSPIAAAGDPW